MVARENDDSVVVKTALLQGLKKLADVVVNIADCSVVGTLGPLDLLRSELVVLKVYMSQYLCSMVYGSCGCVRETVKQKGRLSAGWRT